MLIKRILASEAAILDSNVYTGGGTDVTAQLQAALDEAAVCGGVHLIMDGAALVSGLKVHSNTTIECLTRDCGFFQKEDANCALVTNYNRSFYQRKTRNIILKGGTYNQDCLRQKHHIPLNTCDEETRWLLTMDGTKVSAMEGDRWVYGLEFYGVEHLEIRDLTIRNFRTFAVTIGGFRNVTIENVWLDLPDRMQSQNQDGFHFWGPGQFLTVRNVGGKVGDDFMNIGPDEMDCTSSITDVLVDGVFLDDADQSIRMLSRGTGTLDRVTVRNMSGTYRSFGFYINPWFPGETYGNMKNIFIENIDLRPVEPNYTYFTNMLFNIGGNVESIIIKNVRHHQSHDARPLFILGEPTYDHRSPLPKDNLPLLQNVEIDGLTIMEYDEAAAQADYIQVSQPVGRLALKNVTVLRKNTGAPAGHLISFPKDEGHVDLLHMNDVAANGFDRLIDQEEKIDDIVSINVHHTR